MNYHNSAWISHMNKYNIQLFKNMQIFNSQEVSVTFHNLSSGLVDHAIFHEKDESFCELMQAGFKSIRKGSQVNIYVKSPAELAIVRKITHIPLFIIL